MPWAHTEVTFEAEETVARRAHVNFLARTDMMLLLWDKSTHTLVGGSGLHRFDWDVPRFEIGYWVRTSYAGQGYVTEAVKGISNFAFEKLFAERVEIRMDDRNERSWRVAERCKFKLEGTLRNQRARCEWRSARYASLFKNSYGMVGGGSQGPLRRGQIVRRSMVMRYYEGKHFFQAR